MYPCKQRSVNENDLLTLVTQQFSLPREFVPSDIVLLSDYFPYEVTRGYQTETREMMLEPLQSIIQAMNVDGLQPSIISGYRSFTKQTIAWEMWAEREPARVAIISARPGTSEHQLGTAVDFGSSELSVNLIGNYWTLAFFIHPNIQG